jgi:hypothetical protein
VIGHERLQNMTEAGGVMRSLQLPFDSVATALKACKLSSSACSNTLELSDSKRPLFNFHSRKHHHLYHINNHHQPPPPQLSGSDVTTNVSGVVDTVNVFLCYWVTAVQRYKTTSDIKRSCGTEGDCRHA